MQKSRGELIDAYDELIDAYGELNDASDCKIIIYLVESYNELKNTLHAVV